MGNNSRCFPCGLSVTSPGSLLGFRGEKPALGFLQPGRLGFMALGDGLATNDPYITIHGQALTPILLMDPLINVRLSRLCTTLAASAMHHALRT